MLPIFSSRPCELPINNLKYNKSIRNSLFYLMWFRTFYIIVCHYMLADKIYCGTGILTCLKINMLFGL